jgi:AAA domain/Bifunctional DNA primase/polymerase, N-terminal
MSDTAASLSALATDAPLPAGEVEQSPLDQPAGADPELAAVAALRRRMWDNGYRPIAITSVFNPVKDAGKRPESEAWHEEALQDPPAAVTAPVSRGALNTGYLCAGLRAFDLDIYDARVAARVEAVLVRMFGATIARFRDNSGRVTLVFRAAEGEPGKITLTGASHDPKNGRSMQVEVLGRGQQSVAFGQHPSGAMLQWRHGSPATVRRDDLTAVTEAQVRHSLDEIAEIIGADKNSITAASTATHTSKKGEPPPRELAMDADEAVALIERTPNPDWAGRGYYERFMLAVAGIVAAGLHHGVIDEEGEGRIWQAAVDWANRWECTPNNPIDEDEKVRNDWSRRTNHVSGRSHLVRLCGEFGADVTAETSAIVAALFPPLPDLTPDEIAKEREIEAKNAEAAPVPPAAPALWSSDDEWDESAIAPRPWIAKGYILRGACTALAGAGSAGKSSLLKAWSVAMVLNRPHGKFRSNGPCRVLSYNVEDNLDEERMRLSAILRWFGAKPSDLKGKLKTVGPNDVGTLVERDPDTGRLRTTAAMNAMEAMIIEFKPDVLFLDPLVELHTAEENDNTGLRAVVAHFRSMAQRHNIGVVLAHHTRKGTTTPGDPDAIRGAGSIVGAVRVALTVCTMDADEAKKLGMPEIARKGFFRVDGAKSNYAPVGDAEWFERRLYRLDNGEDVTAAIPWDAPTDVVNDDVMASIKAAVAKGLNGEPYTFAMTPQAGDRSLRQLCIQHDITTADGQKAVVAALREAGFTPCQFRRKANRKPTAGIRSPDDLPENVQWLDAESEGSEAVG